MIIISVWDVTLLGGSIHLYILYFVWRNRHNSQKHVSQTHKYCTQQSSDTSACSDPLPIGLHYLPGFLEQYNIPMFTCRICKTSPISLVIYFSEKPLVLSRPYSSLPLGYSKRSSSQIVDYLAMLKPFNTLPEVNYE